MELYILNLSEQHFLSDHIRVKNDETLDLWNSYRSNNVLAFLARFSTFTSHTGISSSFGEKDSHSVHSVDGTIASQLIDNSEFVSHRKGSSSL